MKKRLLSVILSAVLAAGMLAGCGAKDKEEDSAGKTETQEDKENLKVAAVFNTNLGDKSFSDLVWSGITKAEEDFGIEAKAIELMGDATKQEPTLVELCESGEWDVIVAGTFNLKEAIEKVAAEFPEQKFIVYDTEIDFSSGDYENCCSVMCKQNEGAFLAGALAALQTKETGEYTNEDKVIGFVGGGENSAINDFLVGYIEGAKYVDPECKVLFSYIGDFKNTAKAKELAIAQYQQGADIVFQVASSAGLGVLDAAKAENRIAIGVDQDQATLMKENDAEIADHIMTSVVKNLDVLIYDKLEAFMKDEIEWGAHENAGIAEKGMDIVENEYTKGIVSEEILGQVDEIRQKIASGEIEVKSAMTMSPEELNQIKDSAGN